MPRLGRITVFCLPRAAGAYGLIMFIYGSGSVCRSGLRSVVLRFLELFLILAPDSLTCILP